MKHRLASWTAAILLGLAVLNSAMAADWWASEVVSCSRLGNSPYDDPSATLGKPTTWMNNSGAPNDPDPCAVSVVCPAWNVGLQGEKLITTIKAGNTSLPAGQITVEFATPVYDDPDNWHGKDFIIFGNGFFTAGGSYVYSGSNMENIPISAYSDESGWWEPSPVSVSQDGVTWYAFTNGPYADDNETNQELAREWVENRWMRNRRGSEVELDFTKPVDPALSVSSYDRKSAAQAIDMYQGSGGGTAFDLADLPDLPADLSTGEKWIRYIRITGTGGEVDAFSRVSHRIVPASIGEVKKLDDGAHVVLSDVIVSAQTYSTGRFCYIEQANRSGGIKLMGRVLGRGAKLDMVCGDMDTIDGERVIQATSVTTTKDALGDDVVVDSKPLGMPNRAIGGMGLATRGLLVRTWGMVKSVDADAKSFVIDDGSGQQIKCIAPKMQPSETDAPNPGDSNWGVLTDPGFALPDRDTFVIVTGISSIEPDGTSGSISVLRLRDGSDLELGR